MNHDSSTLKPVYVAQACMERGISGVWGSLARLGPVILGYSVTWSKVHRATREEHVIRRLTVCVGSLPLHLSLSCTRRSYSILSCPIRVIQKLFFKPPNVSSASSHRGKTQSTLYSFQISKASVGGNGCENFNKRVYELWFCFPGIPISPLIRVLHISLRRVRNVLLVPLSRAHCDAQISM